MSARATQEVRDGVSRALASVIDATRAARDLLNTREAGGRDNAKREVRRCLDLVDAAAESADSARHGL